MKSKQINSYFIAKKNYKSVQNSFLMNKNSKSKSKSFVDKIKSQNRSSSFQTVKKTKAIKQKCKQKSFSKISSQNQELDRTAKKNAYSLTNSCKKQKNKVFQDDRSDLKPKIRYISTPKFGQNFLPAQNLTNNRLSLLFELQTIKKQFNHHLNQISLTCLKRLSPLKQNLTKSLKISHDSLQKEWMLIKKSCCQVKNQKDNEQIERMIWQWEKKKKRISDIERNIEKAFELLLL